MFNSTAIEVVIGLVFIYILYSLLVTIIIELFTSILNQRGKILRQAIRRMLDDDGKKSNGDSELLSDQLQQRPEIKYLGNKFMGKDRTPSYISPSTFSTALVNVLRKTGDVDKNFKEYMIKLKVEAKDSETKEMLYNLMLEANGKIDRFKTLTENWYNETMDRAAGWYKRRIQMFTFFIALLIAFALNVDTIGIAKKLTAESDTRIELVKIATEYTETANVDIATTKKIDAQVNQIITDIEKQEAVISAEWPDFNKGMGVILLWILGCLITAIALSLGAPFWFDILNKVSKIRGAGTQEKTDKMDANTFKSKKQTT